MNVNLIKPLNVIFLEPNSHFHMANFEPTSACVWGFEYPQVCFRTSQNWIIFGCENFFLTVVVLFLVNTRVNFAIWHGALLNVWLERLCLQLGLRVYINNDVLSLH